MEPATQNKAGGSYIEENPTYKLTLKKQCAHQEREEWLSFYPTFGKHSLRIAPASYFDERAQINSYLTTIIALIGFCIQAWLPIYFLPVWILLFIFPWGQFFLNLPIYSGLQDCETPEYGFYLYGEGTKIFTSLWLCLGWDNKCIHMPWELDWYRTSNLRIDGEWEHEFKGDRKSFYEDKWKKVIKHETYPYKYVCKGGTVQDDIMATIKTSEMEWRPRWFKWTKLFALVRRSIDIEFDKEVGSGRGSWKGGTVGCSYTMLPNETPLQTLRRMESERRFDR